HGSPPDGPWALPAWSVSTRRVISTGAREIKQQLLRECCEALSRGGQGLAFEIAVKNGESAANEAALSRHDPRPAWAVGRSTQFHCQSSVQLNRTLGLVGGLGDDGERLCSCATCHVHQANYLA